MINQVSAIIVNFNAGILLSACVNSLLNCAHIQQVVVVDNASTDSSLDAISQLSRVNIIRNSVNIGFASACNIGLNQVDSELVLFFNPDCSLPSGSLESLIDCLYSDDAIGMVGGLLINPDGSEQAGGRRLVPTPWRSFVRAFGLHRLETRWPRLFFDFDLHKHPLPATPIGVEAISGACMLVKRQAIESVGLWDEGYFLHCEDLDWCMRFRRKGWKIMFVPTAKIVHEQGACSRSRPVFVEWHKHKGMMRFYRKFFQHQYPGILMWLVALGVWFRFAAVASYYTFRRFWHG
ncbi:glycosyltransferase family 2 protein [Methylomonas rapida]|uniref:Glycosyltransferase family 2 protein n=1 Tax=Methylomonas rapida TaxID=2963939 RepID=A0ABY7GQ31_9GAMM|nr:glycosyltransferase family 2 protein [Methylomonas rapida]WAR46610.1 glycosyltransferase family 2 protein [Methylomonas rapida]